MDREPRAEQHEAEQRAQDADDDVADQAVPVPGHQVRRQEPCHESDQEDQQQLIQGHLVLVPPLY